MMEKDLDVTLYGATGFTGRQTAAYFARHAGKEVRWAIGGRNREKLEQIKRGLGPDFRDLPVIVADSSHRMQVDEMVSRTRVLLTTAGPFARYGEPVVAACVEHETDYVDITGETPFVRHLIDTYHDKAVEKGIRIIPFCGFDSVPSDIGTLFLVDHLRRELHQPCRQVRAVFAARGGFNGGTLASAMNIFESDAARSFADPVLLNPEEKRTPEARRKNPDQREPEYDPDLDGWTAPFFMAAVNTRVVRRSAALAETYGESYGASFTYRESMDLGRGASRSKADIVTVVGKAIEFALANPWARKAAALLGPRPGEGPSEEEMDNGYFRCRMVAVAEDGTKVFATFGSRGDPGNRVTVKLLCESALCLALQRSELPGAEQGRGGVLTPATGLGLVLADRLRAAGMKLQIT